MTEAEFREAARRKCSLSSNIATMRVLSVLRHWVTKHTQVRKRDSVKHTVNCWLSLMQDFESDAKLKSLTIEFLEDILCTPTLLPSEHRASSQLLRMITKDEPDRMQSRENLRELLNMKQVGIIRT